MGRRVLLAYVGTALALVSVGAGRNSIALLAGLLAWGAWVWAAVRPEASSDGGIVLAGALAGAAIVASDVFFADVRLVFYVRGAIGPWRISPAVALNRAALLTALLFTYARLRARWGAGTALVPTVLLAFLVGLLFEHFGAASGLWNWNAVQMPDARIGQAWAFLPTTWAVTFLFSWWFLMPFGRRFPEKFAPIGISIRLAAAYMGFLMIVYGAFIQLYGKAVIG